MRAPVRRWILRSMSLLLLGLMTTLGATIGSMALAPAVQPGPSTRVHYGVMTRRDRVWILTWWANPFGSQELSAIAADKLGDSNRDSMIAQRMELGGRVEWSELPSWSRRYITHPQTGASAFGWPLVCMSGCGYTDLDPENGNPGHWDGMAEVELFGRRFVLPLDPYWPGLIINTLVFACGWLVLLSTIFWARSTMRLRRGRCPVCAYDLNASVVPGCPECGWRRPYSGDVTL